MLHKLLKYDVTSLVVAMMHVLFKEPKKIVSEVDVCAEIAKFTHFPVTVAYLWQGNFIPIRFDWNLAICFRQWANNLFCPFASGFVFLDKIGMIYRISNILLFRIGVPSRAYVPICRIQCIFICLSVYTRQTQRLLKYSWNDEIYPLPIDHGENTRLVIRRTCQYKLSDHSSVCVIALVTPLQVKSQIFLDVHWVTMKKLCSVRESFEKQILTVFISVSPGIQNFILALHDHTRYSQV